MIGRDSTQNGQPGTVAEQFAEKLDFVRLVSQQNRLLIALTNLDELVNPDDVISLFAWHRAM